MSGDRTETLRFPRNLDREQMLVRLIALRESARTAGIDEISKFFEGVEDMSIARLAVSVISALEWLESNPNHSDYAKKLSIVAMNLKNLK